jgi:hypothetical protein
MSNTTYEHYINTIYIIGNKQSSNQYQIHQTRYKPSYYYHGHNPQLSLGALCPFGVPSVKSPKGAPCPPKVPLWGRGRLWAGGQPPTKLIRNLLSYVSSTTYSHRITTTDTIHKLLASYYYHG